MCRVRTIDVGDDPHAVATARREAAAQLDRWELDDLRPDAELLVSELVTNAVLHSRGDVALTLAVADGLLEVGVSDPGRGLPPQRSLQGGAAGPRWTAEGGRGLRLVDRLSVEWGVVALARGKQVWFRLEVGTGWPHRTACPCGGEDLERLRLESGRWAVAAPGPWDDCAD
ncbi:MAG TPA: ATP-binding protein [Actinomycetes bacterium]|nr:ATP-binding protein [Actinomycetes bacterium]